MAAAAAGGRYRGPVRVCRSLPQVGCRWSDAVAGSGACPAITLDGSQVPPDLWHLSGHKCRQTQSLSWLVAGFSPFTLPLPCMGLRSHLTCGSCVLMMMVGLRPGLRIRRCRVRTDPRGAIMAESPGHVGGAGPRMFVPRRLARRTDLHGRQGAVRAAALPPLPLDQRPRPPAGDAAATLPLRLLRAGEPADALAAALGLLLPPRPSDAPHAPDGPDHQELAASSSRHRPGHGPQLDCMEQ